ncbi:hypothetical protein ACTMTI_42340 [Nonomuraea sp. H19]|uniref:hypothetical protein n=1 Tax=Nonomuraea sp. H19 TaxID=3452206 RepID=UPI003F8B9A8A
MSGREVSGPEVSGGRVAGRSRRGRRRRRTGRRLWAGRWVVGVLALAGGAAGLLGANGTFGGAPTASESVHGPGAAGSPARAEPDGRASALPGRAEAGSEAGAGASAEASPGASAEVRAREAPKDVPEEDMPKETTTPAPAESDLVDGSAPPEEAVLAVPGMDDTDGYKGDGPSSHTDQRAAEYFRTHWGQDDKALKRLKDIRTVGGYLRIYTDLPETAHNSAEAIALCKRGLEYLRAAGVARPVVFVQARFGENGNPVLANILGPSDRSCRVTHPAPD